MSRITKTSKSSSLVDRDSTFIESKSMSLNFDSRSRFFTMHESKLSSFSSDQQLMSNVMNTSRSSDNRRLLNFRQFKKFIVVSTQHRQLFESSTRSRDQSRTRAQAKKKTRIQIEKKKKERRELYDAWLMTFFCDHETITFWEENVCRRAILTCIDCFVKISWLKSRDSSLVINEYIIDFRSFCILNYSLIHKLVYIDSR